MHSKDVIEIPHDGRISSGRTLRAKQTDLEDLDGAAPDPLAELTDAVDKADGASEPFEEARYVVQMLPQGDFGFEVDGIFFEAAAPQDAFAKFCASRAGARAKGRKVIIRPCELVRVPG